MRLSRPRKSGRLRGRDGFGPGGGESRATILPRLLMPTASPASTHGKAEGVDAFEALKAV
jgi:hypothetical protein